MKLLHCIIFLSPCTLQEVTVNIHPSVLVLRHRPADRILHSSLLFAATFPWPDGAVLFSYPCTQHHFYLPSDIFETVKCFA
jgi:hypothetical protein